MFWIFGFRTFAGSLDGRRVVKFYFASVKFARALPVLLRVSMRGFYCSVYVWFHYSLIN